MNSLKDFAPGEPLTKGFADFGRRHRQQFPYIIPPFKGQELQQLTPSANPFFKTGEMRCWLAGNHSTWKGRVAAMINPQIPFSEGKLGLIGFFDVIEDQGIAFALFEAALEWLRKKGCTHCWAPVNFSIWHYYRFAVDHFEEKPFVGEPKNPPWYPRFAEEYGFQPFQHWDSWWVEKDGMQSLILQFEEQYQLYTKAGYQHEVFQKERLPHFLKVVYDLMMKSYQGFPGFYHISFDEFQNLYASAGTILERNGTLFLKDPRGDYIGLLLGQRDLGKALTAMNGRKGLFALLKFLRYSRTKGYFNVAQGLLLKEAKEMAYKHSIDTLGKRMSPSLATVQRSLYLAREAGYKGFLFSLMLPQAPNRMFIKEHISKQHRHVLYQMKI